MIIDNNFNTAITSPSRHVISKVELAQAGSTTLTFSYKDKLKNLKLERLGENGKFFGYGICQKLTVNILDKDGELEVVKGDLIKPYIGHQTTSGVDKYVIAVFPDRFTVEEVTRDENTNELTIIAYDDLYKATSLTIGETVLPSFEDGRYVLGAFTEECAIALGLDYFDVIDMDLDIFYTEYDKDANLEGSETIREVLDDVAELTQTIYFIEDNVLYFRRLDKDGAPVYTIDKANYFTLESKAERTLANITNTTQLGDSLDATVRAYASAEGGMSIENVLGLIDVKVRRKNLIYYPYYNVSGNINGVTYTINGDGSITANGTATTDSFFYLVQSYKIPAGTYTLSSINLTANRELRATIMNTDNTLDRYIYNDTFTITEEKLIYIYIVIVANKTVNNVTYKPILEVGTEATAYTPYVTTLAIAINGMSYDIEEDGSVDISHLPESNSYGFIVGDGAIVEATYYIENDITGETQYIRDNAFIELRRDIVDIIDGALEVARGTTITEYNLSWRGNPLVELGDKIALQGKESFIETYLLNDTIEYSGGLKQTSSWSYTDNKSETANNPTTLGEAIKLTYAKVDKVEKEIELVVSDIDVNNAEIASLVITTDNIINSVSNLDSKVSTMITKEDFNIRIENINEITTTTGFKFDADGLTVSKDGTEMTTQVTEDGMSVFRDEDEVLVADNTGVKAENLHATTYLYIGNTSRFEDYNKGARTGCFWMGG